MAHEPLLPGGVDDYPVALATLHTYTDASASHRLADLRLAAPLLTTVVGTDTDVDELW